MTPSGEQTIKDGYYCLSYARKWEPVGNDPVEAQRMLLLRRGELATRAHGGTVVSSASTPDSKVTGTVKATLEAWLQDPTDAGADVDTIRLKEGVAREFQQSCHRTDVGERDPATLPPVHQRVSQEAGQLRPHPLQQVPPSETVASIQQPRTGLPQPMALPMKTPTRLRWKMMSFLKSSWQFCPPHKRLLYTVLLCTGLRKSEIKTLRVG